MLGYAIVPGIDGSDQRHWQSSWQASWGDDAARIEPASWSRPELDDWVKAIDATVSASEASGRQVMLVAHSLGCWAAAAWLHEREGRGVQGVLLVAPPDPSGEAFPADRAPTFATVAVRPLPCESLVVTTTNDPYCRPVVAEALAKGWGSKLEVVGAFGHLNSESDLGEWSRGRELLQTIEPRS